MVSPITAILKLNVKLSACEIIPGGIPEYTPADIAAACGRLKRIEFQLAMVSWAGDTSSEKPLEYSVWLEVVDLAIKHRWRLPKELHGRETLRKLAKMVIKDVTQPMLCTGCGGKGIVYYKQGKVEDCKRCEGGLIEPIPERQRAFFIGVSPSNWKRTWGDRYAIVLSQMIEHKNDAYRHIMRKLANENY